MKKTNNRKSVLYSKWSTIGWELLLLAIFNIILASCDKEVVSGSGYGPDVSIRGSGDVRYRGGAAVTSNIQGSGKVIKL